VYGSAMAAFESDPSGKVPLVPAPFWGGEGVGKEMLVPVPVLVFVCDREEASASEGERVEFSWFRSWSGDRPPWELVACELGGE
jgi:hypothetical protein